MDAVPLVAVLAAYPWLATARLDPADAAPRMKGLRRVGVPYSDDEIAKAGAALEGKTELDALVAYMQVLGTAVK